MMHCTSAAEGFLRAGGQIPYKTMTLRLGPGEAPQEVRVGPLETGQQLLYRIIVSRGSDASDDNDGDSDDEAEDGDDDLDGAIAAKEAELAALKRKRAEQQSCSSSGSGSSPSKKERQSKVGN